MRSAPRSQPPTDLHHSRPQFPQLPISAEPPFARAPPAPLSPRWDSLSTTPSPTTTRLPHLTPTTSIESWTDPPSRPLTAKSSMGDMRSQDGGIESFNFSRPRKPSIRQDMPRPRVPNLPLPEQLPDTSNYSPQPSPRHRQQLPPFMGSRVDSFSSTYNHSHLDDHYSEPKSPRSRGFTNPTPLPQPAFGYGRHETLSTPSPTAASADRKSVV